ncbi:MAG TPA: Gfo/Idh/MocA family oxidoreductase [Chloroflexota bacterium]|nr:Gfo/Idh/MocA family oxidoreductase [Chloroflexota bacterium]
MEASTTGVATSIAPGGRPTPAARARVGVVGAGYWGPKLIRNFAALPEAELRAVCDLDRTRLQEVGEQYPDVQLTTDYAAMLAGEVDAVAIATPVNTHYQLVKQALLAGKHAIVEKPLTANLRQAAELVALAEERNLMLMVGHTFLFEPAVEALRDLTRRGELGDIWHITTRRLNLGLFRPDVNVLWDLAPHDISILLEVLGTKPTAVSARGAAHVQPGIQDVAYVELRFPGDVMAHVHVSWLDPGKVRRMTVVGSQKMAVYDDTEPEKLLVYDRAVVPIETDEDEGAPDLLYRFGDATSIPLPAAEPLRRQCAYFVECVRTGARPRKYGREGMAIVRILEQADHSMQHHGHRAELRWDDEGRYALPAHAAASAPWEQAVG